MSPAPRTPGPQCAVHELQLDQLEDGQSRLAGQQRETHDALAEIRTEVALLRVAVESSARSTEDMRRELREDRERRSLPTRPQVLTVVLAALLAVAGAWVGNRVSQPIAQTTLVR